MALGRKTEQSNVIGESLCLKEGEELGKGACLYWVLGTLRSESEMVWQEESSITCAINVSYQERKEKEKPYKKNQCPLPTFNIFKKSPIPQPFKQTHKPKTLHFLIL